MWTVKPLGVSAADRAELERVLREQTSSNRDRQRAHAVGCRWNRR